MELAINITILVLVLRHKREQQLWNFMVAITRARAPGARCAAELLLLEQFPWSGRLSQSWAEKSDSLPSSQSRWPSASTAHFRMYTFFNHSLLFNLDNLSEFYEFLLKSGLPRIDRKLGARSGVNRNSNRTRCCSNRIMRFVEHNTGLFKSKKETSQEEKSTRLRVHFDANVESLQRDGPRLWWEKPTSEWTKFKT